MVSINSPNLLLYNALLVNVSFFDWWCIILTNLGWQCPWLTAEYAEIKSIYFLLKISVK